MDDPETFGQELYRKSFLDAVRNKWLSDYRIIAIWMENQDAYDLANRLASESGDRLSTIDCLRALVLALVMGGVLREDGISIRSSISFVNRIQKSKRITALLESSAVRNWVQKQLDEQGGGQRVADYRVVHLDAKTKASDREQEKSRLRDATDCHPYGVLNVGIFGEGVDAPSLSAVGFLEPRKSPVDVVQAVGRVMRRSEGKTLGYIICPVLIPPGKDAEDHLRNSRPRDGWNELGEILLALRSHDSRIETDLPSLIEFRRTTPRDQEVHTIVAIGRKNNLAEHYMHTGAPKSVISDVEDSLRSNDLPVDKFKLVLDDIPMEGAVPGRIVSARINGDGSVELREGAVQHDKPGRDEVVGLVNIAKSKEHGRKMLNGMAGRVIHKRSPRPGGGKPVIQPGLFDQWEKAGITVNLLERSGLTRDKRKRDVNLLRSSIQEATRALKSDDLDSVLDRHYSLDNLSEEARKNQADGCTIASLILMNALMLHHRIAAGKWLGGITELRKIKNAPDAARKVKDQWETITRIDFLPVLVPAIEVIREIRDSGRLERLNLAIRHLAAKAEGIAEHYADLGADHAGELFNKVMGNQASDGAYFTRPPEASILARLALDVSEDSGGDLDWTSEETWGRHRTVDFACGSGTLLASVLSEMKRRAKEQGADTHQLGVLQKLAVERLIAGLDFNPISLQLAASQLMAGSQDVVYKNMCLHKMDYGPRHGTTDVAAGTLELLGQKALFPRRGDLYGDQDDMSRLKADRLKLSEHESDPLLEDVVSAVKGVRMVVMNPPFSSRSKTGQKFPPHIKKEIDRRTDVLHDGLIQQDPELYGFADKNSIRPMFVALAERCLDKSDGILAMINPTVALTATSGLTERRVLAERFHIHTILTSQVPRQTSLSQSTGINESIIIARRTFGQKPETRIISLDRVPLNEEEASDLHDSLSKCQNGLIPKGWGEVSYWPSEYIQGGDWTAVVWRSPCLAKEASQIANDSRLLRLRDQGVSPLATGRTLRGGFEKSEMGASGSFPIIKSKAADAQTRIEASPDEWWIPKSGDLEGGQIGAEHPETRKMLKKGGYLLITAGQGTDTARLTAVAGYAKYVGNGWMPVPGINVDKAKALAVFLNSTSGRLQIMRFPGRKLQFPTYSVEEVSSIRAPDLRDSKAVQLLSRCWERTKDMVVPQFREGESPVRRLWDEAVCEAMGWDLGRMAERRHLLHREPFVCGYAHGEYRQ